MEGLTGLVDGPHYWDAIADNCVHEYKYHFPNYPTKITSKADLLKLYSGYGNNITLKKADHLLVHHSQDLKTTILEYECHGILVATGKEYSNRFISVVTVENRKIVHWKDYMDSLAAFTALTSK